MSLAQPKSDGASVPHAVSVVAALQSCGIRREQGHDSSSIAAARAEHGWNELQAARPFPWWKRLLAQFQDLVILLLLGAAIVSGALNEWSDSFAIVAIVIINGLIGFVQEERAQQALAALQKMSRPQAKVVRNGTLMTIAARELVPGDVIEIEAGDDIPADARLLSAFNLGVQEAALTGESVPTAKDADAILAADASLGDRRNMVYMGTIAASGKGRALITAIGMRTELGRIAGLLEQNEPEPTPLQRRLAELGKVLVALCLGIVFVVFLLQWFRQGNFLEAFLTAVGLAVAAVPEGLPAVVTVALALGLQRMVRRNALVRKLPSVETLGSVTVICSDKTGTLTRNEMTVQEIVTAEECFHITGSGYAPHGKFLRRKVDTLGDADALEEPGKHAALRRVLLIGGWCNNGRLQPPESAEQSWSVVGDPTEGALIVVFAKAGLMGELSTPRVLHEIPFDSTRKFMTMLLESPEEGTVVFAKGAPEVVLAHCQREWVGTQAVSLTPERREYWSRANAELASQALRVLAMASRPARPGESHEELESDLILAGLVGMLDPPRDEARAAIAICRAAGIRPVMITGDHPATAFAIARSLRLTEDESAVIAGPRLESMSDDELRERVPHTAVFARATAEHKIRIVKAWQARGDVVAMTGDGVNDAPAVQAADIGIAMGLSGTDVTKAAADMVLTDDNFASIVSAVEEGRGIYDNIRKVLQYLLACNFGELLLMFFASLFGWPSPLLTIQLLWINLITDGIPALALTLEPTEPDVMQRAPRPANEPILSRSLGLAIVAQGLLVGCASLMAFAISHYYFGDSLEQARAVTFCVLVYNELLRSLSARSNRKTVFELGWFGNPWLLVTVVVCVLLQVAVSLTPGVRGWFEMPPHDTRHWVMIVVLALIPITVVEVTKIVLAITRGRQTTNQTAHLC
jgi:Ca2+-transporting ATPase